MSTVYMQKGSARIYVDSTMVDEHQALGWSIVAGAITFNGPDISLAPNPPTDGVLETLLMRHYSFTPAASSAVAIHAAMNLAAAVQAITSGITSPDYPRNVTIKGGISGQSGDVVITGTNLAGDTITDTIALSGTAEVSGVKAFKSVTKIDLPVQTHTPTAQVETATAAGTITQSGNATITVTAAGMTGTPKAISVAVLNTDTADVWAGKVRTALAADAAVAALFNVSGATDKIILTRKTPAADDGTLNIASTNGTCLGITPAGTSANTTTGVPYDTVSIGMSYKFGLPHILGLSAVTSSLLGSVSTDSDELEKNLFTTDSDPGGATLLSLWYYA
jgi:hypothetical protein